MNEHELTVEESIPAIQRISTKNGSIHNRKQRYVCKDCGRQFIENPPNERIPKKLWDMVDKLLLEKIPIAKQWIWLALDSDSREIVGMHVGSRDHAGAEALWKSLPPVYRQCAVCYTDLWSAYEQVLPQNRHRAVGEENGKANRIERLNLTLRQRISRLVRKTLSFSKKIENHIGAIWNFIHYYNAEIAPKLAITTY